MKVNQEIYGFFFYYKETTLICKEDNFLEGRKKSSRHLALCSEKQEPEGCWRKGRRGATQLMSNEGWPHKSGMQRGLWGQACSWSPRVCWTIPGGGLSVLPGTEDGVVKA